MRPSFLAPLAFFFLLRQDVVFPQSAPSLPQQAKAILEKNCFGCHGATKMAELDLRQKETVLKGGSKGPAIIPGKAQDSLLYQAVAQTGALKMPMGKDPLTAEQLEIIRKWIDSGAEWTDNPEKSVAGRVWWAFQKPEPPAIPTVKGNSWVRNPIDAFVLHSSEEKGIRQAPPADKLVLLRRAKFDLHGLPPTVQETEEFLADQEPDAFARLVNRLLDSPRYGEKWGRHWLDVARYADSTGLDEDLSLPYSWRYRDYVIDAFNRDLPYDEFVSEQLAGDLLPPDKSEGAINFRGIVATGFLALGPKPLAQQDKVKAAYDVIDEQIDTTSKAFLGLTIACARCHDHKFDPVSTKDYYSLASIFASTRSFEDVKPLVSKLYFKPLVPAEVYDHYREHLDRIKAKELEIEATTELDLSRYVNREFHPWLAEYMVAAWRVYQEKAELKEIAHQNSLNEQVLKRWVQYLKPGTEFRPYLEKWHQADSSNVQRLAEEYQKMFDPIARQWNEKLENWAREIDAAIREGKAPPDKPEFLGNRAYTAEDRFFAEVSFEGAVDNDDIVEHDAPFALPKKQHASVLQAESKARIAGLSQELEQLKKAAPPEPPMACAVAEGEMVEQRVFVRGSHQNPGDLVAKQFPVVLAGNQQTPITQGSGRKELAQWMALPSHPLTARVMVNRIWQWHFGEGLVRTPDNFGATGEKPTHPELLDYLATEFVRNNWSVKSMHRLIMLSNTYQMSSHSSEEARKADPDNRLLSRFNRRKLTVEEMRDALLALDGSLDLTMGGTLWPSDHRLSDKYGKRPIITPEEVRRRSVYLPLIRNKMPSMLKLFDFVDSTTCTGKRNESNIAPQALFMLNSQFVRERARSFAALVLTDNAGEEHQGIERAYWRALSRKPKPEEIKEGIRYLQNYPKGPTASSNPRLDAWQSLCHVLLVSNEFQFVE